MFEPNQAIQYIEQHGMISDDVKDLAIEALKKQIPVQPHIKPGKRPPTHKLGRLLSFYCPKCARFIVACYETDPANGGGISDQVKGCSTCLQAIDFSPWYPQTKPKPKGAK